MNQKFISGVTFFAALFLLIGFTGCSDDDSAASSTTSSQTSSLSSTASSSSGAASSSISADPAAVTAVQTDKSNLTLVAGNSDPDGNFSYSQDSVDSVTGSLKNLKTSGTNGTTITWSSGSPSIIGDDGTHKFASDKAETVTFTATISKDGYSETKDFTLKVQPGFRITESSDFIEYSVDRVGDDLVIAYKDSSGGITVKTYQTATGTLTTVGGGTIPGSDGTPNDMSVTAGSLNDIYVAARTNDLDNPNSANIYHYNGSAWSTVTKFTNIRKVGNIQYYDGKIYVPFIMHYMSQITVYTYDSGNGWLQIGSEFDTDGWDDLRIHVENSSSIHCWYGKYDYFLYGSYWNGSTWNNIYNGYDSIPGMDVRSFAGPGSECFVLTQTDFADVNLLKFDSSGVKTIYGGAEPAGDPLLGQSESTGGFAPVYDGTSLLLTTVSNNSLIYRKWDGSSWVNNFAEGTAQPFSYSQEYSGANPLTSYNIGSYIYSVLSGTAIVVTRFDK